jgi:YgiT-type zinc finger domain-containing protein
MGARLENPDKEVSLMKHEYANCSFCGGVVKECLVNVDYRTKNGLVIIENVPAGVCCQCNERYFTAEAAKIMEKLAHISKTPTRVVSVPIRRFSEY